MFNKAGKFSGAFTKIYNPLITSPTASQIVSSRTPIVSSSAFSKYGTITHASTDWQVASDSQFANIVWQSLTNTTSKTSITTGDLGGGTRYLRVRYKSNTGIYSDWSDAVLFTSPWATGTNGVSTLINTTVMEINSTDTVTVQPGTYRFILWGAGGGGGANGPAGGGGGCVSRDITYASATTIGFTIGTAGAHGDGNCGSSPCGTAAGGSPGGGSGSGSSDWRGGGGGGYSSAVSMIAAGGGGGSSGGGYATAGGESPSVGGNSGAGYGGAGCAGWGGGSGSSGGSGGGGGGGSHQSGHQESACESGNGGSNGGSYSVQYAGSGSTPGNSYYSSTFGRTFGASQGNGGAKIEKIATQYQPIVSITSNLSSTASSTAGSSLSFSITATDTANNDGTVAYQWYVSTDGGSNYSAISGQNAQTLTRYQPFYYSDNGNLIKCRATVTNSIGTHYQDSTACTLTVARNYDCSGGATVTGTLNLSSSGPKPSTNGNGDDTWGTWSPGYDDICEINGSTNSFNVKGRFCNWQAKLELRITRSTDGTRRHWGDQTRSGTQDNYQNFQLNANGGGWDPGNDGIPTFRLMIVDSDTQCQNGNQDIGAEQETTVTLSYSYKRRTYYYDSRP